MSALPTGTVTFFFSDIEGSTRLVGQLGDRYAELLERHRGIVRDAFARHDGREVGTEGDSFFAVFRSAAAAVAASVDIQRTMSTGDWPADATPRARIGLHTGQARIADADYVGLDVHRAARVMAVAHGGQIVVSQATQALAQPGLDPGVELRDLGEHRLRDLSGSERLFQVVADGIPTGFPPLRSLTAIPNNLPTVSSRLVGRSRELAAIRRHLDAPGTRLLTLTGPGGIGKTRLALHAAVEQIDRSPDGVFFVDLAAAHDADTVLDAIAQTLRLGLRRDEDLLTAVAGELRARQLLLVLDNFEQVTAAAGDVAELLRRCPGLRILVTSREALRIRGEQRFPVPPLPVPDARGRGIGVREIEGSEAVGLFVERAREARPDFELTDDTARVVAEICVRLDGLPLALELAAARVRLFSVEELRDRLESRLELLRGGARDLPARQRTLRSTIEWSYDLLDDGERRVFEVMSLFPSARIDAVERVCGRLEPLADVDVVDALGSLLDKSLLHAGDTGDGQRLSMLETIREYAGDRLGRDPDLAAAARRAHALEYADAASARLPDLHGRGRAAAAEALATELANLQAAWRFLVEERDIAQLRRLLDPLWLLHEARGSYHAAVALMNDLLEVLQRAPPSDDRAEDEITVRIGLARAFLALRGYTEQVAALYREALALAEAAGAVPRLLPVLRSLASFHLYRGEIEQSAAIGREILDLAAQQGDDGLAVEGYLILGAATAFMGDPAKGLEHLDRAIALFDPDRHGRARFRLGPSPGVAAGAVSALLSWVHGYPEAADRRAAAALELATRLQHPYSTAYATFHVALLDLWDGRLERTRDRAEDVLRIAEEHDYPIWTAVGLVLGGVCVAALGDPAAGLARAERGIALYTDLRTPPVFWPQILGLRAQAYALANRLPEALEALDEAQGLAADGSWDSAALKIERADLLIAAGTAAEAPPWLEKALEESRRSQARMLELRAATLLARLRAHDADHGADAAASEVRAALAGFTEGFDHPAILEARAVLEAPTPAVG